MKKQAENLRYFRLLLIFGIVIRELNTKENRAIYHPINVISSSTSVSKYMLFV